MFGTTILKVLKRTKWRQRRVHVDWLSKQWGNNHIVLRSRAWPTHQESTGRCQKSWRQQQSKSYSIGQESQCNHHIKKYDYRREFERQSVTNFRWYEKSRCERSARRYLDFRITWLIWRQWTFSWVFDTNWEVFKTRRYLSAMELLELGCSNFELSPVEWGDAICSTGN